MVDGAAVATSERAVVTLLQQAVNVDVPPSPDQASIDPGATATFTGSAATAAVPARGATESDRDYTNRLYGIAVETFINI